MAIFLTFKGLSDKRIKTHCSKVIWLMKHVKFKLAMKAPKVPFPYNTVTPCVLASMHSYHSCTSPGRQALFFVLAPSSYHFAHVQRLPALLVYIPAQKHNLPFLTQVQTQH